MSGLYDCQQEGSRVASSSMVASLVVGLLEVLCRQLMLMRCEQFFLSVCQRVCLSGACWTWASGILMLVLV